MAKPKKRKRSSIDDTPLEQLSVAPECVVNTAEERVLQFLRNIPNDLKEAITIQPLEIARAASRLHGLVTYWNSRLAEAEEECALSKLLVDSVFAERKMKYRAYYGSMKSQAAANQMAIDKATSSQEVLSARVTEYKAKKSVRRVEGLVKALMVKRDMLKLLGYMMANDERMADEAFTLDDDLIQDQMGKRVRQV